MNPRTKKKIIEISGLVVTLAIFCYLGFGAIKYQSRLEAEGSIEDARFRSPASMMSADNGHTEARDDSPMGMTKSLRLKKLSEDPR